MCFLIIIIKSKYDLYWMITFFKYWFGDILDDIYFQILRRWHIRSSWDNPKENKNKLWRSIINYSNVKIWNWKKTLN